MVLAMVMVGLVCALAVVELFDVSRRADVAGLECQVERLERLVGQTLGTRTGPLPTSGCG
jgi:type II secretory pathway pseudopilin PulG